MTPVTAATAGPDGDTPPRLRILLVGDDDPLCRSMKHQLKEDGHRLACVAGDAQGLALARTFRPQLVLVDGAEACRALRRGRRGEALYIVALLRGDDENLLAEAFDAGADDFLTRPVVPLALQARVDTAGRLAALRRKAEREHRAAHRYLDIVDAIVLGLDADGGITLLNRKGCDLLGYQERELLGNDWFRAVLPGDCREPIRALFAYAASGNMEDLGDFETVLVTRNGERRLVAWRSGAVRERGRLHGFLLSGQDITERRAVEQERERLLRDLAQAQKMQAVGNLTGGIAHNFNNILASVIGYTELAQDALPDSADDNLRFFLNSVHDAGIEARGLVENLMKFSRGNVGEQRTPLLLPVLNDVARMLQPVLTASMPLHVQASELMPRVLVNPEHIHQMVTNLCINARDAMGDSGAIEVRLRHRSRLAATCDSCHQAFEGEFVELNVCDQGPGIPDEVIARMFEPFFTTKAVGKGTGLGMSMVHGTMHDYGGHVLVESAAGKGTCVRLLFPVQAGREG